MATLGEAWVTVSPDASGFRLKADAAIRTALAGINPDVSVKVKADTTGALASIVNLRARMDALSANLASIKIGADGKPALATITTLQGKLLALAKTVADITLSADTSAIDAKIAALQAKLAALVRKSSDLQIDADTTAAISKIANLELEAHGLEAALNHLTADIEIDAAVARLYAIEAELQVLRSDARNIEVTAQTAAIKAAIAAVTAEITALQAKAHDIRMNVDTGSLIAAQASLLGLEVAAEKVGTAVEDAARAQADLIASTRGVTVAQNLLAIALGNTQPMWTRATGGMAALAGTGGILGNAFGILGTKVTLFGGLLQGLLPAWATHISVMHIAADVLVELIAVWGGAAVAAGAFGVAASDAVQEVARRMTNLHIAADATTQSMYPLTGALETLHNAVRPEVYQVFGDALVVAKAHTGDFQKIVRETGPVVDQLAGRMTAALTSGTAFDIFTKNAKSSLLGLGTAFGNVFGAIGNVLNVVPDYAQKLLTLGVALTGVLENVTRMLEPVLRWGLVIHGAFIYIGLATSLAVAFYSKALVPLAGAFYAAAQAAAIYVAGLVAVATSEEGVITLTGVLDAALAVFKSISPLGWITIVVAGLVALALWLHNSSSAANDFTASIQKVVGSAGVAQTLGILAQSIAATRQQLVQSEGAAQMYSAAISKVDGVLSVGGHDRSLASQQLQALRQGYEGATNASQAYAHELAVLQGNQQTFNGHLQDIAKITGSTSSALGALTAAGITQNQMLDKNVQDWAATTAQVLGTLAAYKAMNGTAGALNNNLDVLSRTETDQYTATQKLNQGWSSFIGDVTGSQGTFDTLALGMVTLDQNFQKAGGSGETLRNTLGKLSVTGTLTGASMDGLNQASLDLNQAFGTQVSNANALFASWRTAGLAGNLFTQGVKDAIIPLVKYASGSKEATAQLVALAQEAGYHGTASLKDLTNWLGQAAVKSDEFTSTVKNLLIPMVAADKGAKNASASMLALAKQAGYTGGTSIKDLTDWLNSAGTATQNVKDITDQATTQEALLTDAMQAQGDYIANTLIGDINQAILKYDGVQKAAANYGNALAQFGKGSTQAKAAQDALVKSLIAAGMAANDSGPQIAAMIAKVLGVSMQDAIKLMATLGDNISKTSVNAQKASALIDKTFIKTLQQIGFDTPGINSDITKFSQAILSSGDNSNKTQSARDQLIKDLEAVGVQSKVAQQLVTNLQNQIDKLHGASLPIGLVASGKGKITAEQTITGSTQQVIGNLLFVAKGGQVPGSGNSDSVFAMLTPGEVVIPRNMVRSGAIDHLRGALPGFAGGGVVGVAGVQAVQDKFVQGTGQGFEVAMGTRFEKAANAALVRAIAAAVKGAFLGPGSANYAADITTVLSSLGLPLSLVANWLRQIQTECVTLDVMILTRDGWKKHDEVQPGDETIGYNPVTGVSEWTRVTRVQHYESAPVVRFGNEHWEAVATPNHRWLMETVVRRREGAFTELQCPDCGATGSSRGPFRSPRAVQVHRGKEHKEPVTVHKRGVGTYEQVTSTALVKLEDKAPGQRIVLARLANLGDELPVSVREAALLGWIAGDGCVMASKPVWRKAPPAPPVNWQERTQDAPFGLRRDGTPRKGAGGRPYEDPDRTRVPGTSGLSVTVSQAKAEHFAAIEEALAGIPGVGRYAQDRCGHSNGPGFGTTQLVTRTWHLPAAYARDLLARAGNPKTDAVSQVLRMSAAQREAWLGAMIAAEGHREPSKTVIYQNDGPVADAIELAVYLSGNRPARRKSHGGWGIGITSPYIGGPSRVMFVKDAGTAPVWCCTTQLGSWTARLDGHVFLTGNSGGNLNAVNLTDSNAQAGHPSVGLLQLIPSTFAAYAGPYINTPPLVNYGGGPVSENPMAQIYAAIHYALARYGPGMGSVIGQGHGYAAGGLVRALGTYDRGGILPAGGIGINTTRHAEMVTPAQGPGSLHETNLRLNRLSQQLDKLIQVTGTQGQAFARGLSGSAARGASMGYYGR
jgi:hypothetical protein